MSDDMASKEDRDDWGENELFLVLKCSLCCRSGASVLRITAVYKEALRAEERKVPCLPAGPEASAKRSSQLLVLLSEQKGHHQEGWCLSRASSVLPGSSPTRGWCCHVTCPLGPQQPPGQHQPRTTLLLRLTGVGGGTGAVCPVPADRDPASLTSWGWTAWEDHVFLDNHSSLGDPTKTTMEKFSKDAQFAFFFLMGHAVLWWWETSNVTTAPFRDKARVIVRKQMTSHYEER